MSRLVVLTDSETALGFQLTGVEVIRADDFESARAQLLELMRDANVGLIAVNAALLEQLDELTRRRIEASYKPVVVSLPAAGPAMGLPSRREYLAALIRRAIGFQITFPGEGEVKHET
jgi:V/A-type H+-transporting ATPase subunit F